MEEEDRATVLGRGMFVTIHDLHEMDTSVGTIAAREKRQQTTWKKGEKYMAVAFNPGALDIFREAQLPNENSIANLDGRGGIKANGKLGSFLWKPFRSDATRSNNNAVRTELLKSLGQAFSLSGVSEASGKVMFSKDFMTSLEKLGIFDNG